MIISPLPNKAVLRQEWVQLRPVVTQKFGENPKMYEPLGLKAHNGIDLRCNKDKLYAPMDGIILVKDSGKEGYGLHVRIRSKDKEAECVLGHLDSVVCVTGQHIKMGELIGFSGNSGFGSGPHLHLGYRLLKPDDNKDIYQWTVLDYNNGYKGYIDILNYIISWKGTLLRNTI